jgi:hypothetical protein
MLMIRNGIKKIARAGLEPVTFWCLTWPSNHRGYWGLVHLLWLRLNQLRQYELTVQLWFHWSIIFVDRTELPCFGTCCRVYSHCVSQKELEGLTLRLSLVLGLVSVQILQALLNDRPHKKGTHTRRRRGQVHSEEIISCLGPIHSIWELDHFPVFTYLPTPATTIWVLRPLCHVWWWHTAIMY